LTSRKPICCACTFRAGYFSVLQKRAEMTSDTTIEGFVLITVPKNVPAVMRMLEAHPTARKYIEEMALLFGGADIYARIKIPSIDVLHTLVIEIIQEIPEVATTQTFIIDPKAKMGINRRIAD
jgi:DNA-binding Lrp family transcriptional regulator